MGNKPYYEALAKNMGHLIASHNMQLVYGAGSIGLMGTVARAASDKGADVIGIIPEHLDAVEITQSGLAELHVTDDMHERKKMMFERSDAFIVLPGGLGTLEELFESATWNQLRLHGHSKPIVLLDPDDYWQPIAEMLDRSVERGFVDAEWRALVGRTESAATALAWLQERG